MVLDKKVKFCELRPTPRFFVWSWSSSTLEDEDGDSAIITQGLVPKVMQLSEVLEAPGKPESEFREQSEEESINKRDNKGDDKNSELVNEQVRFSKRGGRMVARELATHSFIILRDDLGSISKTYRAGAKELNTFFADKDEVKEACTAAGNPYFDERGLPMWFPGYERCGVVREAYRIHAGRPDRQPWPSHTFRDAFLYLQHKLREICDAALVAAVPQYTSAPPSWVEDDGDLSVCYALHYPNFDGGSSNTPPSSISDENDMNVAEHRDPSLMVIEPCCGVPGLEIQDHQSKKWIPVENVCQEGTDLVLFCGREIESATGGSVSATTHRVRQGSQKRVCFIFEQKYRIFFSFGIS